MLQVKAVARPPGLAFRGLDERGDVASHKVPGLCMSYSARECVVAHGHGGAGVALGHRGERIVHITGRQFAQLPGADRCQDRRQDILVLLDRLGRTPAEPFLQPVFGCAPDRVALIGLEAGFEFLVELLQSVLNGRLGFAGDPGADPLPVRAVSQADRASPPPLAVPVPLAVTCKGRRDRSRSRLRASRVVRSWFHDNRNGSHFREPIASHVQPRGAMPGDIIAARSIYEISLGLHGRLLSFHGKEKVYGSIP